MFIFFTLMVIATIGSVVWIISSFVLNYSKIMKSFSIITTILCMILTVFLSQTAQTKMAWINFTAGANTGIWLVTDNSGGETLRHWVLHDGYVDGCTQTDGWEFFAESCSPCKVGGDSFVGKISKDQLINDKYKRQFNIPEDQEALH